VKIPLEITHYTGNDVGLLGMQFPFLSCGTPSSEDTLDQLGINLGALDLVDRRVGD
jgi:hypothetical protein